MLSSFGVVIPIFVRILYKSYFSILSYSQHSLSVWIKKDSLMVIEGDQAMRFAENFEREEMKTLIFVVSKQL